MSAVRTNRDGGGKTLKGKEGTNRGRLAAVSAEILDRFSERGRDQDNPSKFEREGSGRRRALLRCTGIKGLSGGGKGS